MLYNNYTQITVFYQNLSIWKILFFEALFRWDSSCRNFGFT